MASAPRRRGGALLAAAGVACVVWFFAPVLVGEPGVPLAPGDGWLQNLPVRTLLGEELRAGRLPLWNPFIFAGFPLLGDPQSGALYPLNWLFAVLPPAIALNLGLAASYLLAFTGAAGLARRRGAAILGALVAGAVFGLSGFLVGNLGLTLLVHAAAWLPVALWAADRLLEGGCARDASLLAFAVAMQFLAGHVQTSFYTGLTLAVFVVLEWRRTPGAPARARWRGLAVALVLAGAMVLPQVVAGLDLLRESARSKPSFAAFAERPMRPRELPLVVVPYLRVPAGQAGSTWSGFVGVVAIALAWTGWRCRQPRDGAVTWAVLLATGLVLALGAGWEPLGRALFAVPGLGAFRVPRRWLLLVTLAAGQLAGLGLTRLADRAGPDRRKRSTPLLEAAAFLGAAALVVASLPTVLPPSSSVRALLGETRSSLVEPRNVGALGALALVVAAATLGGRGSGGRRLAAVLLAAGVLAELWTFDRHAEWRLVLARPAAFAAPLSTTLDPASAAIRSAAAARGQRVWTLFPEHDWGVARPAEDLDLFLPNTNLATGVATVSGYSPLLSRRWATWLGIDPYGGMTRRERAARWLAGEARTPDVLAAAFLIAPRDWAITLQEAEGVSTAPRYTDVLPAGPVRLGAVALPQSWFGSFGDEGGTCGSCQLVWQPASPVRADRLLLAGATAGLAPGTRVARLRVAGVGSATAEIGIEVGAQVADWRAEPAAVRAASPVLETTASDGTARLWGAVVPLPTSMAVRALTLDVEVPAGGVWVPRALATAEGQEVTASLAPAEADAAVHGFVVRRQPSARPRVWLARSARRVHQDAILSWLEGAPGAPAGEPEDTVLLEDGELASGEDGGAGRATLLGTVPGRYEIDVTAPSGGWLVVSESWYRGWHARCDGGAWRPTVRAYGLIQAVRVEPGHHRVEVRYRPVAVLFALPIAAVAAFLALLLAVRGRGYTRRP